MDFFDNEQREIVDTQYFVDQVASSLNKHEYRSAYIDAMQAQGIQFTDAQVRTMVNILLNECQVNIEIHARSSSCSKLAREKPRMRRMEREKTGQER